MKLLEAVRFRAVTWGAMTAVWLWAGAGMGQWITQTIRLHPGWNAVYLETAPQPGFCDDIFAGLPVDSAWKWNRTFSTAQFIHDPNELIAPSPDWLMWQAPTSGVSYLNTLAALEGNTAYMIHVATNAAAFDWVFKGRVMVPWSRWFPFSLNLMGLAVNPAQPPSLAEYFRATEEVAAGAYSDAQVFRVKTDGAVERIRHTARYTAEPHVAYWIGANNPGDYSGPLEIEPKGGLEFGEELQSLELTVQNLFTNSALALRLRPRASELPPAGQEELAGEVPLSYYDTTVTGTNASPWVVLNAQGISKTIGPAQTWTLLLAVRRGELSPYAVQGTNGAAYQSWLEITDDQQTWLARVPVTAEAGLVLRRNSPQASEPQTHPAQGLWFGGVTLDAVNAPHFTGTNTLASPSPFSFVLILHVDGTGRVRLLQHVTLALTYVGTTTNLSYILLGDMNPALPTAAPAVNRLSSAAFPVMDPLLMTGSAVMTGSTLTASITLDGNDPMNPFLHLYHPMHDNKDANGVKYATAVETAAITRNITIQFTASTNPAAQMAHTIWGADFAEGAYQEVVGGLRREPITTRGNFYLRRISRTGVLN